jgi:hypothetical protein
LGDAAVIDGGRIAAWAVSSGTAPRYVAHWQPHKPQACEDRGEALRVREHAVAAGKPWLGRASAVIIDVTNSSMRVPAFSTASRSG